MHRFSTAAIYVALFVVVATITVAVCAVVDMLKVTW